MATWFGPAVNICLNVYNCTDPCRQTVDKLDINHPALMIKRPRLLGIMERLRSQIAAGERLGRIPSDEVLLWLQNVEGAVTRLNRILGADQNSPLPLPEKCPCGCCYMNMCGAYEYAKEVENMVAVVDQLIDARDFCEDTQIFKPCSVALEDVTQGDLVGMDGKFQEVWTCLDRKGFECIGIHGMGGVGKTALLKRVHNHLLEEGSGFDRDKILMVEMSAVMDIPSALLAIGKKLGLPSPDDEVQPTQIMTALQKKRFVLLLDDLREVRGLNSLAKIGVPTHNIQNKTKVVFTTRNIEVCDRMGADLRIELQCLEGENPWILFQNVVQETTLGSHGDLRRLARTLADMCGGLPLAIVTIGGSMRGRTSPDDWLLAIERLKRLDLEPCGMNENVVEATYNNLLETKHYPGKSCFLYASLFPKTCLANEEELIHYWIAEGILKEYDALRENLIHGRTMIGSLKRTHLLDNSNTSEIVTMHDMIRGGALRIARDNFFVRSDETFDELSEERNWTEVERVSLIGNSIDTLKRLQFDKLSTLILKKCVVREIRYDFFDSMPCLNVLDMSWCNIDTFLKNITELTTLQYLNFSHTNISELPADLQNLKKLKFLDLSYLDALHSIPPGVFVNLTKLQSLNLYHSGFRPADGEGVNRGGNVLYGDGTALLKELEQLKHLDNIGLTLTSGLALQTVQSSKKLKCLHSLFIADCERDFKSLEFSSIDTIENLKVVRVQNCADLEELTICWGNAHNGPVTEGPSEPIRMRRSFKKLRDVEVEGCWELKDLSWLKYAPLLEFLKIKKCTKMNVICSEEVSAGAGFELNDQDLFSNLRSMYLFYLPELKSFSNFSLTLPVLEQITILNCPNMEKLPLKAENANGTLKVITINEILWGQLKWEEAAMKSAFHNLCKFE